MDRSSNRASLLFPVSLYFFLTIPLCMSLSHDLFLLQYRLIATHTAAYGGFDSDEEEGGGSSLEAESKKSPRRVFHSAAAANGPSDFDSQFASHGQN
ncbi:hypothetical protein L2E82_05012 [Cichorium intybus]|uniref:Uncharacterized protein n=1 Tax=Cichorium intybus TaxID=13427 RepID=A0ACB9H6D3_CICIN|nr:hypothetical protein L2E82_05012 [Cichorium intybus]